MSSSLSKEYDVQYANDRLSGTIVSYEDEPYYVNRVEANGMADVLKLNHYRGEQREKLPLRELDLTPVKLGYMNLYQSSHYLKRSPIRQYKQGLRKNNMSRLAGVPPFELVSVELYKTIKGTFPSIDECLDDIENDEAMGKAFSREFSFQKAPKSIHLYYKGNKVGDLKKDRPQLYSKYMNLHEKLEECMP